MNAFLDFFRKCPWRSLEESLAARKKPAVLEIGFGAGEFGAQLKRKYGKRVGSLVGVDVSKKHLGLLRRRLFDKVIKGDALRVPFPRADMIVSMYSLGYVGHPDFMLKKISNALLPGGEAFLHLNNTNRYLHIGLGSWYRQPEVEGLIRQHSYDNLANKIRKGKLSFKGSKIELVKAGDIYSKEEIGKMGLQEGDYFIHITKERTTSH